ncbi:MAG: alpha/beta hydrolase [Eubacteriales bacterium]|nr:alpha/beta hydrolase [Eubacteriales bacterium]
MKNLICEQVKGNHRYLVPDLSGHGSAAGQTYRHAKEEADEIYEYLADHHINTIDLTIAASLGGVVVFHLLEHKDIRFTKILLEGTSFHTSSPFVEFAYRKAFLSKHKKALKDKNLAIEKMSRLYGKEAGKIMADVFVNINEESIVNIVHDCTHVHLPSLTEAESANIIFTYGSKDFDLKRAKKMIPKIYPKAKLLIWPNYNHCEKMTADRAGFCKTVTDVLERGAEI